MANVLYIEDDDVAIKAMDGIARRDHYNLHTVKSGAEAWKKLLESVDYDIIIAELKLRNSNTLSVIKEIRANPFLAGIPIVIYSKVEDKEIVKKLLTIGVQNYFFKPYKEQHIVDEVSKAVKQNWQIRSSGHAQKFYKQVDETINSFHAANRLLSEKMEFLISKITAESKKGKSSIVNLLSEICDLAEEAKHCAFESYSDMLNEIITYIRDEKWDKIYTLLTIYPNAQTLQSYRLEYIRRKISGNRQTSQEAQVEEVFAETITTRYSQAESEDKIKLIKDYPVIESAAAAFQMALDDEDTNLDEIVEMVQRDAGLAASLLRFANSSEIAPGATISDIHQAISTLGLQRTKMLSLSLKAVPTISSMFSALKWEEFWVHQVGCAMLTEEIGVRLKLPTRREILYLSGLIQDMGKVLLHEIDKELYKQAIKKAHHKKLALQEIEREYFGCSHDHAGLIFAKDSGMSEPILDAIKYQFEPNIAPKNRDAVAALSLANYFCMKYEVGDNGDRFREIPEVRAHPAWSMLKDWQTPSFSASRFLQEMENKAKSLKFALTGLAKEHAKRL